MKFNKYKKSGDYHWKEYQAKGSYWEHAEKIKHWITEKKILDVGAGDGLITSLINAVGIDNDKLAPKLANSHGVPVFHASIYNIPFTKECFEAVFMGDVIEHLEDVQAALFEIRRVIKTGGYVYITTPPAQKDGTFHDAYHYKEFTTSELISTVQNCGFLCKEAFIDERGFNTYAKFQKTDLKQADESYKILIFSHSSRLGGAERSLLTLVRELIQTYHTQVTIVLPPGGPSVVMLRDAGANIIIGPIHWWCTGEEMPDMDEINRMMSESFEWVLNQIFTFRQLNPDIILTNTMVIPWGAVTAALMKKPHLWMINEFGELDHGFTFYLPFEKVLRIIKDSSDLIISRSDAIRKTLFPDHNNEKIQTIYRSIELPARSTTQKEDRATYFEHPSACRLAIIGTIRRQKGQKDAVEAVVELIKNRNRHVELVMAGHIEEEFRGTLEQIAQVNGVAQFIHIHPFQTNVYSIIEQADIILVCSKIEAFGRVILESLLLKKPVIATNTGGTPEIISEGNTGLLYTPGDVGQLVAQIEKLIDNPDLRENIAINGYEIAQRTFTKENYAGAYNKLFKQWAHKNYSEKTELSWYLLNLYQNLFNHKNNELRQLTQQNDSLEQEVVAYAVSKSWRITRPFRKIIRIFKGG